MFELEGGVVFKLEGRVRFGSGALVEVGALVEMGTWVEVAAVLILGAVVEVEAVDVMSSGCVLSGQLGSIVLKNISSRSSSERKPSILLFK